MASWAQNQPRQFKPYTPEVNEEVYASALAKKDLEYQEGAKKVEQFNSIAGHIPVARPTDQKYVQGIANQITSTLNQKIGESGDLSDQKLVNHLGVMASTMANDSTVQTIVANTSRVKAQMEASEDDTKRSKGANTTNLQDFNDQYQAWYNNDDPKSDFDGKYTEYHDIEAWSDNVMKTVKPLWSKIDNPAKDYRDPTTGEIIHAYQQYNKETNEWEEIPEKQIRTVLEEGIKNNPEIATQMSINARQLMKGLGVRDYVASKAQQVQATIASNTEGIKTYNDIVLGVKSIPDDILKFYSEEEGIGPELIKKKLAEAVTKMQDANKSLKNYDFKQDIDNWNNPDFQQSVKNELYKNSWIQQKVDQYGGKTKDFHTLEGDPVARELAQARFAFDQANTIWDKKWKMREEARGDAKEKERRREWTLEHPGLDNPKYIEKETDVNGISNPWEDLQSNAKVLENSISNQTNKLLYSSLPKSERDRLFNSDVNGNITIKPGVQSMDDNGKTIDQNQEEVQALLNNFINTRKGGNFTLTNGSKVPITQGRIMAINKIMMDKKSLEGYKQTIDEGNKKRKESGVDVVTNFLDNLDKEVPLINQESKTNFNQTFTKEDIQKFIQLMGSSPTLATDLQDATTKANTGSLNNDDKDKLVKKYGDNFWKYAALYNNSKVNPIVAPSPEKIKERADWYNSYAKQSQLVPITQMRVATTGDAKADLAVKHDFRSVLTKMSGSLKGYPIATSVLKDENKNVDIATHWEKGQLYVDFTDLDNKGVPESVPIPSALSSSLSAYIDPDRSQTIYNSITQTLMGPEHTNFKDNNPNWEDAYPIDNKNGLETRVGFEWNGTSWIQHIFIGHTIKDAKEKGNGTPIEGNAETIGNLVQQEMIKNNTINK